MRIAKEVKRCHKHHKTDIKVRLSQSELRVFNTNSGLLRAVISSGGFHAKNLNDKITSFDTRFTSPISAFDREKKEKVSLESS
jgi:hypothetical protein